MSEPTAIPIIDIGLGNPQTAEHRLAVARKIADACETIGFFAITGHGVDPAQPIEVAALVRQFFDGTPDSKHAYADEGGFGYIGPDGEQLAAGLDEAGVTDFKESLNLRLPIEDGSWPGEPAGLRPAAATYLQTMIDLAAELMQLFALGLDLPANYFDDKIDQPRTIARLLNYPPLTNPQPGQTRAGAHTDYGTLTILWSEDVSGLQAKNRADEWVDVLVPPDAFVINIGDLMMNWTNDRWLSTIHRVIPKGAPRRRQSIAFFHNPNPDAMIECLPTCHDADNPPRYAPITAWEHLEMKINKSLS